MSYIVMVEDEMGFDLPHAYGPFDSPREAEDWIEENDYDGGLTYKEHTRPTVQFLNLP